MQIPHEAFPLFIAISGASDRAKHENKVVGCTAARASLSLNVGGLYDEVPSEENQLRIAEVQKQALLIIHKTMETMVDDISAILSGQPTPASLAFSPKLNVFLMQKDSAQFKDIQSQFLATIQSDTEAAEALSTVTSRIVGDWQG